MYFRTNPLSGHHTFHDAYGLPAHKTSGHGDHFAQDQPDPNLHNLDHAQEEAEELFYLYQLEDGRSIFHGAVIDSGADYLNAFLYEEELLHSGQGWNDFEDEWDDMHWGCNPQEFLHPLEEEDPFDPYGGF